MVTLLELSGEVDQRWKRGDASALLLAFSMIGLLELVGRSGERPALGRAAHALLGMSAVCGADGLVFCCRALEKCGRLWAISKGAGPMSRRRQPSTAG